jgi:hypothetical protein
MNEQLDEFTRLLGKSAHDSTSRIGPYDIREVEWTDGLTSFELLFKIDGANIEESATLSDNALARQSH